MKKTFLTAAAFFVVLAATQAMAVSPGNIVEWKSTNGTVTFKGDDHAGKGMKCNECHSKIFRMKKGSTKMKMADIYAGKFCGVCHNGQRAFKPAGNCAKCHKR
jgi:c(7)-type cytochrome triheme protein